MSAVREAEKHPGRVSYQGVILLVGLVQLVITTDFSVISVTLPSIGKNLALSPSAMSWVVSALALPHAGLLILSGRAADLFGQRRCMLVGLLGFGLGSLLCALAPSYPVVLAGRALQGIGGAVLIPANFSLINTLVPEGAPRHRALGVFGLMQGVSLLLGLVVGGWMATEFGWRAVFLLNLPVIAGAALLTLRLVPRLDLRRSGPAMDWAGAALISLFAALLLSGVSSLSRTGAGGLGASLGLVVAALVCGAAFFLVEARAAAPLVPPSLLRRRNLAAGGLIGMLHLAGVGAFFVLTNLYMQRGLKFTPLQSGLGMMPYAAAVMLAGYAAPKVMGRMAHRSTVWGGFGLYLAGLLIMSRLGDGVGFGGAFVGNLILGPMVCAFGSTTSFMALMGESTGDVEPEQQGVASAVLFTTQQLGVPLGVAMVLAVLAQGGEGLAPFRAGYLAAAGTVGLGLLASVLLLRPVHAELAPTPVI